jgi:flagellar basal body rod protein FlgC
MYAENERVGLICSVIANANRNPKKKSTPYKPSDFVNCGKVDSETPIKKKNDAQKIFDTLKLWCKGGGKK